MLIFLRVAGISAVHETVYNKPYGYGHTSAIREANFKSEVKKYVASLWRVVLSSTVDTSQIPARAVR